MQLKISQQTLKTAEHNMAAEEEFHEDNLVGSKSANHENFQIALFLIDIVPFP